MPFVTVSGDVKIFVQDWGPKTGKPIVFIHGYPYSHRTFEYQMLGLANAGFRVIALDLRGFGESDKPWQGNDYDTWVSDIHGVLVALTVTNATLVGFSMGGAIASHYAGTQTDGRVTKLVLLGAATPNAAPDPKSKALFDTFIEQARTDHAKFVHDFVTNAFHNKPSMELHTFLDSIGYQATVNSLLAGLEQLRDRDLTASVKAITLPTLICHGTHDKAVPFALGELQNKTIPGSKLVKFEKSGHLMPYEEKDKLLAELTAFHGA